MGPSQLSGVMEIVEGGKNDAGAAERKQRLADQVQKDLSCYRTSAALHDDGVIDPRDTRDVLGICLEVVCSQPFEGSAGHRGLARI